MEQSSYHFKLSEKVIEEIEKMIFKIIRDYNIYGMSGINEIPDPNLSTIVDMLGKLKKHLDSLEELNAHLENLGIVNSLINSKKKIQLAEELLDAVKEENEDLCDKLLNDLRNQL